MHLFMCPVQLPETTHIRWLGTMCETFYAVLNCRDSPDSYSRPRRMDDSKRVALFIIRANDPSSPSSSKPSQLFIRLCTRTHIFLKDEETYDNTSLFREVYISRQVHHSLKRSFDVRLNLHLRLVPVQSRESANQHPLLFARIQLYDQNIIVSGRNNLLHVGSGNIWISGSDNLIQADTGRNLKVSGYGNLMRFNYGEDNEISGNENIIGNLGSGRESVTPTSSWQYVYVGDGTFASWSLNDLLLPGPQQAVVKVDLDNKLTEDRIALVFAVMKNPDRLLCQLCNHDIADTIMETVRNNTYESAGIPSIDLALRSTISSSIALANNWHVSATLNGERPNLPFPETYPDHWRSFVVTLEVEYIERMGVESTGAKRSIEDWSIHSNRAP
jgi:hypothetical protein